MAKKVVNSCIVARFGLFCRWIRTHSENPTVSYCQTLVKIQEMKKINFLIILAIVTVNTSFCQKTKWINFTVTNNPYYTLAISESNIWACSDGGIIQINRETENLTIHRVCCLTHN